MTDVAYSCRDERLIEASPERCFSVLADLSTYAAWWTLVRVVPQDGLIQLKPGGSFRIEGSRRDATSSEWTVRVLDVEPPARIDLEYTAGALLGRTAWELTGQGTGTRVAYVYRDVRANDSVAAATFSRFGIGLHQAAMQLDALAGLARYLGGPGSDLDSTSWREQVYQNVAT
ncbi:MAG: SRPBCC domain-containing protein, partial [bacterium]